MATPWGVDEPGIVYEHGHDRERFEIEPADRYRLQSDNFSRAIRGLEPPLLGRADALGQARAIDALYRSAEAGGEPASPSSLYAVNPTFMLGGELEVRRLGFGAMRIVKDRAEGVRVVRRAVELGVNFIDTADIYGAGVSEEVIAEALHPYPDGLVIATKGGLGWGLQDRIRDGRPEHLREACEASLRRLKLERIDLYQLHRHDPEVPLEESIGALEQLRAEGKIRMIGVSNFSLEQLRQAQAVTRIVSVQNQFNRGTAHLGGRARRVHGGGDRVHALVAARRGAGARVRLRDPLAPRPLAGDAPDPGHVERRASRGEHARGRCARA